MVTLSFVTNRLLKPPTLVIDHLRISGEWRRTWTVDILLMRMNGRMIDDAGNLHNATGYLFPKNKMSSVRKKHSMPLWLS
jgi:hypothetical protein